MMILILGWCKWFVHCWNLPLVLEYILNKCGYVIYHFNVHLSLFFFFANDLLLHAAYFIFNLDYGKLLRRWEYQTILPVSWETCTRVKKQQSELCMEELTGSGLRKEYGRAVCCHPVCLTNTLSTSWEMRGWMSYKLESR